MDNPEKLAGKTNKNKTKTQHNALDTTLRRQTQIT